MRHEQQEEAADCSTCCGSAAACRLPIIIDVQQACRRRQIEHDLQPQRHAFQQSNLRVRPCQSSNTQLVYLTKSVKIHSVLVECKAAGVQRKLKHPAAHKLGKPEFSVSL